MTNQATYQEYVGRYRIVRHDELPKERKAALRLSGIDPDDNWSLIWSFDDREAAEEQLRNSVENALSWQTYKMIDNGESSVIERPVW